MNTVERELVDRNLKIHIKLTKLLRIHPGDAAVQEHGLAAMEHFGKHYSNKLQAPKTNNRSQPICS